MADQATGDLLAPATWDLRPTNTPITGAVDDPSSWRFGKDSMQGNFGKNSIQGNIREPATWKFLSQFVPDEKENPEYAAAYAKLSDDQKYQHLMERAVEHAKAFLAAFNGRAGEVEGDVRVPNTLGFK